MMRERERRQMFVKGVHILYRGFISILLARLYNWVLLVFSYCRQRLTLLVYAHCHIADKNADITLHNFICLFKDAFNIQGDQRLSVHLMITILKAGAQRRFDHPVECYVVLNYRIIKWIIYLHYVEESSRSLIRNSGRPLSCIWTWQIYRKISMQPPKELP